MALQTSAPNLVDGTNCVRYDSFRAVPRPALPRKGESVTSAKYKPAAGGSHNLSLGTRESSSAPGQTFSVKVSRGQRERWASAMQRGAARRRNRPGHPICHATQRLKMKGPGDASHIVVSMLEP